MNHKLIRKEYCQSCGMPLRFDIEEYLGTNADHSRSDKYCYYCLKDGKYTVDIPLNEMVDIWVKYTGKYNEYSETSYTPGELRTLLNKRLPTLKRWRQKQNTEDIHYKTIGAVRDYIDRNLNREIDMDELCNIANLSLFHLRRVFRDITGENIGSYIQRLRLENVAHKLVSTGLPIGEIVKQSGYQTKSSLAKAFRKHFGISMTVCREQYVSVSDKEHTRNDLPFAYPEIRKLKAQKVAGYPVGYASRYGDEYKEVWEKVTHYRRQHVSQPESAKLVSISLDNSQVTQPGQRRFYIGVLITKEEHLQEGELVIQEIPAGLYAMFTHKGNYSSLPEFYRNIYENWLPGSGYIQRNTLSFEIYLNSPRDTESAALLTEVYIPIEKK